MHETLGLGEAKEAHALKQPTRLQGMNSGFSVTLKGISYPFPLEGQHKIFQGSRINVQMSLMERVSVL